MLHPVAVTQQAKSTQADKAIKDKGPCGIYDKELRAQLRAEKMGEPLSAKHGSKSAIATKMTLHDKDMDECPLAEQTVK